MQDLLKRSIAGLETAPSFQTISLISKLGKMYKLNHGLRVVSMFWVFSVSVQNMTRVLHSLESENVLFWCWRYKSLLLILRRVFTLFLQPFWSHTLEHLFVRFVQTVSVQDRKWDFVFAGNRQFRLTEKPNSKPPNRSSPQSHTHTVCVTLKGEQYSFVSLCSWIICVCTFAHTARSGKSMQPQQTYVQQTHWDSSSEPVGKHVGTLFTPAIKMGLLCDKRWFSEWHLWTDSHVCAALTSTLEITHQPHTVHTL